MVPALGVLGVLCLVLLILLVKQKKDYNALDVSYDDLDEAYDDLKESYDELQTALDNEDKGNLNLKQTIKDQIKALTQQKVELDSQVTQAQASAKAIEKEVADKKNFLVSFDDDVLVQEFGLYQPRYVFANSAGYKDRLTYTRGLQKELIKGKIAVTGAKEWTVNGSKAEGKKMISDFQKLLLRAFNGECDDVINKATYMNIEASRKRINASCEAISKLGKAMSITIAPRYLELKLDELTIAFEFAMKKQEEKEEQKEIKARMREEARLQKEIEEAMKKVRKEETHYATALQKIETQLAKATDEQKEDLLQKKAELENNLKEIEKNLQDIDYRQANARAGYVYIISNIGSFGEDVYKIGMTRRLEPMDRVDELGDASVPFNFDVHAMIFSDDAPSLENALHKAFEQKKVNMVNHRREFFHVSLSEVEAVVLKNYDKTVEFTKIAAAEQYRQSVEIRKNLVSA